MKSLILRALLIIVAIAAIISNDVIAATVYIDSGQSIQTAINNSNNGDTVILNQGIHTENINMAGKAITLRSTNPNDFSVVAATIIDGGGVDTVIKCISGETSATVITGLTITNGNASGGGGGVCNISSSPTVSNCTFNDNTAYSGGGMCNSSLSAPQVTNCTFIMNNATGIGKGGGICNYSSSNPQITNCIFIKNTASNQGGGVYSTSSPIINNSYFGLNTPNAIYGSYTDAGGNKLDAYIVDIAGNGNFTAIQDAIDIAVNGDTIIVTPGTYYENISIVGTSGIPKAVTLQSINPTSPFIVEATIIDGNSNGSVIKCTSCETTDTVISGFTITNGTGTAVPHSGGTYYVGGGIYNVSSSPMIINCILTNNTANDFGGGMNNEGSSPRVVNCKFSSNTANSNGGGMYNMYSYPTVIGCTFSSNAANNYGGGIYNSYSSPVVMNSFFCSNTPDAIYGLYTDGGGNNLLFCPSPVSEEFEADLNNDGSVDILDIKCLAAQWLADNCPDCHSADLNGDGDVNFEDYAVIIKDFTK